MDDEETRGAPARRDATGDATGETTERAVSAATGTRAPRKRRWGVLLFGIFIILPILLIALWTTIALSWSYSDGFRTGYVQKLSQKGWLCKTWEGEIAMVNMPGQAQEKFAFSVRNDSVAHEITRLMGGRVTIHYEQHPGIPLRCLGETEYFITGVKPTP